MNPNYEKLLTLLRELFQLDQPDLDFGLYRVMRAKSAEVSQFLDKDLLPQVQEVFGQYKTADKAEMEKELSKAVEQAQGLGVDPETTQKVKDLRLHIKNDAVDVEALEREVYDHLFSFFRRYYSEGDFLAKRVYKAGVYAIPYEGEEVTLHWANKDQYYIKTSEYLRDYAFRLRAENEKNPMRVHFRLVDAAEGEHGNVKAAEGKDRVFVLAAPGDSGRDFIVEEDGEQGKELVIRFEYRPATVADWPKDVRAGKTKPPAQKDLTPLAAKLVLAVSGAPFTPWIAELSKPHIITGREKADYSRLEANLKRYTARNTFDYFIHKDLGGFLRRELDFYIKNEVMHLDDVENESVPRVEQYLSEIKVIRKIAGKIIDFLAQLEDFQKKLWLKKKFVVETQYCITLGSIPESFYPEITTNQAQQDEWVRLYAIDEIKGDLLKISYSKKLKPEFLKANPTLVVDTRHFDEAFTARLLETIGDIDDLTDGVLFHGDNFQSLEQMNPKYRGKISSVYLDPPYNTDATPISYKNGYRHASWISLVEGRLLRAKGLLDDSAIICITIDDVEVHNLRTLLDNIFPEYELLGQVPIKNNPAGRTGTVGFSICHEYALFYGKPETAHVGRLEHSDAQKARYKERDDIGAFEWTNFRKHGGLNTYRTARPRQFYPIFVKGDCIRFPNMKWDNIQRAWNVLETPLSGEELLLPIDENGRERIWDFVVETAKENLPHLRVRKDAHGETAVYRKWRLNDDGLLPQTWWDKSEYSAAEYGTNLLAHLFGETHMFTFPKSIYAVNDCLKVANLRNEKDATALDYYAGSGTTAHAVINLNREDEGRRKFILVEMGDYFDTVLLPRIKKVTFSPDWKDGKPKRYATSEEAKRSPRIVKVLRLESYEDTLNNLEMRRSVSQQNLLDSSAHDRRADGLKEQYLLRYMLDVETRGSQSLLNVGAFADPTAYKLKVKRPGSDESREVNVDLLETFNWLIGLTVKHIAAPQTFSAAFERDSEKRLHVKGRLKQAVDGPYWFRTITGITPDGRKTLIIWRKLTGEPELDNLVLDEWFTKQGYSSKDSEFDIIYVNGGNNLENLKTPDDTWKVRLIEEDFQRLMFEMGDK
jgi:adenine-specific DNA-methyltransferase